MIYGIVAQDEDAALIVSTLASLDFVNGAYTLGNTSLAANQVVSNTARISADGLSMLTGDGVDITVPSGELLTMLLGRNYTCLIDVNLLAGAVANGATCQFFMVANMLIGDSYALFSSHAIPAGVDVRLYEQDGGSASVALFTDDLITSTGIARLGYTRQNSHRACTFNGLAVVSGGTDDTSIPTWVYTAAICQLAYANDGTSGNVIGHIRKITVIPAVTNLELATLTA